VSAPADGKAWTDNFCIRRAIRGGAWNNVPIFVRSAARVGAAQNGADQDYDYSTLTGFRVARDLP
jgi:formylglycine-generating enzyme required for sulfatase activity